MAIYPISINEDILRKIIFNHGVDRVAIPSPLDTILAKFGTSLNIEVTEDQMKYLETLDEEING